MERKDERASVGMFQEPVATAGGGSAESQAFAGRSARAWLSPKGVRPSRYTAIWILVTIGEGWRGGSLPSKASSLR